MDVPTVDQDEISAICRLQSKAFSTDDIRVVGDYLLDPIKKAGNSHVFLATMQWAKLESIKTTLNAAGLTVQGIHVAEFVLADTLATSTTGITMHVLARDRRIEFLVCCEAFPVAAQTFPFLDDGVEVASVMPALGSRVLQSVPPRFREAGLASVDLYGEDARKLESHFKKYFDVPVHYPDGRREPSLFLLAVATASQTNGPAIDFASPKIDSIDLQTRTRRTSRAVLAAVLCAMIIGVAAYYNYQLDNEYAQIRYLTDQTAKSNRAQQSAMDAHRLLKVWNSERIDLPTQFAAFAEHLPSPDRGYLQTLHLDASRKSPATINATGHAKSAADVIAVHDRIVDDSRFVLHPQGILSNESDKYTADFSLRVTMKPRP